ncbi:hypothetical protein SDC9_157765 [bioreactor metagenome]|uniref:Uncharacterized protein n=1 Tax=bioreactor metagenome TaxID=1076179 RepID=A0A645F984_9ZZZZ
MLPALVDHLLGEIEQRLGTVGIRQPDSAEPALGAVEVTQRHRRLLRIDLQDRVGTRSRLGIVAVQHPVATRDRRLLPLHSPGQVGALLPARGIGDDQRRTRVGGSLIQGSHRLLLVRVDGDLGDVHVAVATGEQAEVLLTGALAGGGELRSRTQRGGLRRLATGVGVNLGVEDQHVHVLAGGQQMIQTAESDVVGPAVTAHYPHRGGHQGISQLAENSGVGIVTQTGQRLA